MKSIVGYENILEERKSILGKTLNQHINIYFAPKLKDGVKYDFIDCFVEKFNEILNQSLLEEGKIPLLDEVCEVALNNSKKEYEEKIEKINMIVEGVSPQGNIKIVNYLKRDIK